MNQSTILLTKRTSSSSHQKCIEALWGYIFILPMVLGFLIFLLGPVLYSFARSFTNWSLADEIDFVGLKNYIKLFTRDTSFMRSLKNTLVFTLWYAPLKVVLGLALAILLFRKIKGVSLFRTILFTPVVVTHVVWGIVWKLIFSTSNGIVNQMLGFFGIESINWLYDKHYAMMVVIIVCVLKNLGMNMVLFLAALQDISPVYYEAGMIDGANSRQAFWKITLPLLTPSIFMVTLMTFIDSLKVFTSIYVITGGGPAKSTYVLVYYLYQQAFGNYQFGYASAIAVVLFVIIMAFTMLQWNIRRRWVFYEQ